MRRTSQSLKLYFESLKSTDNHVPQKGSAAVLLGIVDLADHGLSIILTLRSPHLNHHPGEVSFPGGMWESPESYPLETALREANEEIALPASAVNVLGYLKPHYTRRSTRVVPVVGLVNEACELVADNSEIVEVFTVPISYFLADDRIRTDIFTHRYKGVEQTLWTPAYHHQGFEIWGFTAAVITHFLNRVFNANITRQHPSDEKVW